MYPIIGQDQTTSSVVSWLSANFSIPTNVALFLLVIILVWSLTWKLFALWKSAKKGSVVWFIVLGLVNTLGILEILYIYVFSEMKTGKSSNQKRKRK